MRTRNRQNKWKEELSEAFKKMPNIFTIHDFNLVCRQLAVSNSYLTNGGGGRFLSKVCFPISKKTWQKTKATGKIEKSKSKPINQSKSFEKEAIDYLKELGYEIYKIERVQQ